MTEEAKAKMLDKNHILYTETKHNTGFQLRIGDTVQLFGDKTHTYTITDVSYNPYTGHKTAYFSIKDGKSVKKEVLPERDVSAIISRAMPKKTEDGKGLPK
jgi:hypothetical protein